MKKRFPKDVFPSGKDPFGDVSSGTSKVNYGDGHSQSQTAMTRLFLTTLTGRMRPFS